MGAEDAVPQDRPVSRSIKLTLGYLALRRVMMHAREKGRRAQRISTQGSPDSGAMLPVRLWRKAKAFVQFCKHAWQYERHVMAQCRRTVKTLAGMGYKSICLYGVGHEARVLELLAREAGIEISAVASWDGYIEDRATRTPPRPEESLAGGNEIVLVADMVNIDPKIARLVELRGELAALAAEIRGRT